MPESIEHPPRTTIGPAAPASTFLTKAERDETFGALMRL
jgi:hypothetical protein